MRKAAHKNNQIDLVRAKRLRRESTPCEQKLWKILLPAALKAGLKFRRQHPLHPYIADFVRLDARLVIELDGISHDTSRHYDQTRDDRLKEQGYLTIRFSNHEAATNTEGVVEIILETAKNLREQKNSGNPSPAKARGLARQAQAFASSPARGEE